VHVDWTVNVENMLVMGGVIVSLVALFWKMHTRLIRVEQWIEIEGDRTDRALNVMETMSLALERVSTLYEQHEKRMDRMQGHCDRTHHG
jgi:hypothetical protein